MRVWQQLSTLLNFPHFKSIDNSIDKQVVLSSLIQHALASPLTVMAASSRQKEKLRAYQQIQSLFTDLKSPAHYQHFQVLEFKALLVQQLAKLPEYDRVYFGCRNISKIMLYGKKLLLVEAVMCLVKNSLESNLDTVVGINIFPSQKSLKIVLSDFGKGMNGWQQLLFSQPFITTKSRGFGIGLPFVKWVVEVVFDGQFDLLSKSNLGTMIVLKLPMSNAETNFPDKHNPPL